MIKDVVITHLDVIDTPGGNVLHAMKESSAGYSGFGEAYFSQVDKGAVKAWKRHKKMILNLVAPVGAIKFVLFDDRDVSNIQFQEIIISSDNYCRLTVPPMIWMGFQGLSVGESLLLNIANIEHDTNETDRLEIDKINYDWSIN
ncbi:WxcM-like domain-containing protein [Candidatus Thioglobus sp.]|nr:WxcM-like domain-containing protein [Candidatus Thioglobus sp.]